MSMYGWRQWNVKAGALHALTRPDVWFPGRNEAGCRDCLLGGDGSACPTSGFYAYREPAELWRQRAADRGWLPGVLPKTVLGVVELFGRITEHERGYRAQYGRVVAIAGPEVAQIRPEYEVDRHADFASLLARWWDGEPVDLSEPEPPEPVTVTVVNQVFGQVYDLVYGMSALTAAAAPAADSLQGTAEILAKPVRYPDDRPRWQSPYGPQGKRR